MKPTNRRILLVANSFAHMGGVECRTVGFIKFLKQQNVFVAVALLRELGQEAHHITDLNTACTLFPVYNYSADKGVHQISFSALIKLMHYIKREKFDAVYGLQPPAHYFCRIASLPLPWVKKIAMERETYGPIGTPHARSRRLARLDKLLSPFTHRTICVSKMLAEQVIAAKVMPAKKVQVIENGVTNDPDHQPPARDLIQRIGDKFVFGTTGSLSKRKRTRFLLEAFRTFLTKNGAESAVLLLAGGYDDEENLETYASELGIEAATIFTGHVEKIDPVLALIDCFVFPSAREGLGTSWIEAMHHGIPVISSDIQPMNDYIRHEENGLLFALDNLEVLVSQMQRLYQSEDDRKAIGQCGKSFAEKHFDFETQYHLLLNTST